GDLSEAQLHELEAVAGRCPVHKLMTAVTTEISTKVERLP
ncbi:MAG: OsmC family peroxiredoxin, partial [Burkholderiaceae bacterium]|nr:OsmC family peroxiredoxin [Burkholderiaceae bacterium]